MYKIFINENPVFLCSKEDVNYFNNWANPPEMTINPRLKIIKKQILKAEVSSNMQLVFVSENLSDLVSQFISLFDPIVAAGGVVVNHGKKVLMIFRRGFWDLPKGKIDKGESPAECAIREVKEETGIGRLTIRNKLSFAPLRQEGTYHTYKIGDKRVLKLTHWYEMEAKRVGKLKPQKSEGIEKVEWVELSDIHTYLSASYGSIKDVLDTYDRSVDV